MDDYCFPIRIRLVACALMVCLHAISFASPPAELDVYRDASFKKATVNMSEQDRAMAAAVLNVRLRQYAKAAEILRRYVSSSDDPEAWCFLAYTLNRNGDPKEAKLAAEKTGDLTHSDSNCSDERGMANYELGDYSAARHDLSKAVAADRGNGLAYYYLGLLNMREHRYVEARYDMLTARILMPRAMVDTDYAIALIDAETGRFAQSISILHNLNEAYADDADPLHEHFKRTLQQVEQAANTEQQRVSALKDQAARDARNAGTLSPR